MTDPIVLRGALRPDGAPGLPWEPFRPGVEAAWIYRGPDGGPASAYLRYAPGARVPRHRHVGYEHVLVLSGSQTDANGRHRAGTLVVNPPGTSHDLVSEDGCVVLIVWEKGVAFDSA